MSETKVRRKLAKFYDKAAKKIGSVFMVYRPVMLNDAFSAANYLKKQHAAFTLSKSFTDAQKEGFQAFICYTDHLDVKPGDIFDSGKETFVIVWNRGIEDVVAVKSTELVEIYRGTWDTADGLQSTRTRIAKNVPASIIGASSTTDTRLVQVQSPSQTRRWDIRIWATKQDVVQTDNIKLSDGTLLHVDSVKVDELYQVLSCSEVAE